MILRIKLIFSFWKIKLSRSQNFRFGYIQYWKSFKNSLNFLQIWKFLWYRKELQKIGCVLASRFRRKKGVFKWHITELTYQTGNFSQVISPTFFYPLRMEENKVTWIENTPETHFMPQTMGSPFGLNLACRWVMEKIEPIWLVVVGSKKEYIVKLQDVEE